MIYFFFSDHARRVVFVDVFEKKKRAIEPADLKVALKRKAAIEGGAASAPLQNKFKVISSARG
jgi:hypothetical protein